MRNDHSKLQRDPATREDTQFHIALAWLAALSTTIAGLASLA
jgi:hypothetical protein